MIGIIEIGPSKYIFRDDTSYEGVWAWNIHDDPGFSGHVTTHKWPTLPRGIVTVFNIDDPPETVGYVPILAGTI
jgi:hypothetical protein